MTLKTVSMKSFQTFLRTFKYIYYENRVMFSVCHASVLFRLQTYKHPPGIKYLLFSPSANICSKVENYKKTENDDNDNQLVTSVEDPNQPLVKLIVITKEGQEIPVEARVGMTVMKAVTKHENIPIEGCKSARIKEICHDGRSIRLMEAIQINIDESVGSIVCAACGGECACTTCHVYCEDKDKYFTDVTDLELDLLDAVPCSTNDSRLCCQMKIIKEFDSVRIQLPSDDTNYFEQGSKKSR